MLADLRDGWQRWLRARRDPRGRVRRRPRDRPGLRVALRAARLEAGAVGSERSPQTGSAPRSIPPDATVLVAESGSVSAASARPTSTCSRFDSGRAAGSRTWPSTPMHRSQGVGRRPARRPLRRWAAAHGATHLELDSARRAPTPTASTSARAPIGTRSASAGTRWRTHARTSVDRPADPLRLHRPRRAAERRQVDPGERAGRLEGRDRLRPAADDSPRGPGGRDGARRLLADGPRRPARGAEAPRRPHRADAEAGRARAQRLGRDPPRAQWRAGDRAGRSLHRDDPAGRAARARR